MDRSFNEVHDTFEKYQTSMRTAALITAIQRVADATTIRGIYP
jgi:glutamate dehydrogenase (NAD(P)+)